MYSYVVMLFTAISLKSVCGDMPPSPQGVWGERVKEEVEAMITDLQLLDKKNVQVGDLSGGQKRKLRYPEREELNYKRQ